MRTIKVTGKGNLKVKPDMTRVTMTLEGVYPEYEETLQKSAQDTGKDSRSHSYPKYHCTAWN